MFNTLTTDGVTISYLARRNRFQPISKTASLLQVAQLLAEGVHRVAIVDDNHEVVNIVSQSTLVNFLSKHLNESGVHQDALATIGSLHIGTHPVIAVKKQTTVIETLRIMDSGRRSGVAIVDEHGRLVGTTTGKDLGLFIKHPTIAMLEMPIFKFLSEVRQQSIEIKSPTIAVFPADSLMRAIGLLAATRVHRVFVVDNEHDYKPTAVISITDILNLIVKPAK
jgi:5'-AMP-activated protein kinase, regulatory gamma subunit